MKNSLKARKNSLKCEIPNIGPLGLWLLHGDREYFLSHTKYPWFKKAKVEDVLNVKVPRPRHFYWPALDVDLHLESLENPDHYPLIAKNVDSRKINPSLSKKAA